MCRVYCGIGRTYVRLCARYEREHLRGAWVFQPSPEVARARINGGHYVGPFAKRTYKVAKLNARRGVRASQCHH